MRITYQTAWKRALRAQGTVEHWRSLAEYWGVSAKAKERLEWLIFYQTVGQQNARRTAAYFGISAKTFHKWKRRFNPRHIQSLEDQPRAPKKRRTWQVTPLEQERVIALRRQFPKYGKAKLKVLYQQSYQTSISTWKIERIIRRFHLYPDPAQVAKRAKRLRQTPKTRIHQVPDLAEILLWHVDTIQVWWYGQRRYIFTALEHRARLGFARVYPSASSRHATDFLKRLFVLSQEHLPRIHSDNGSEFAGHFEKACRQLGIQQIYSRVRQPKDNPRLERFNWTIQDEWLALSEIDLDDIHLANLDLTNWLVEYNSHRPHQALAFQTPLAYASSQHVLPMSPASTST